MARLSAQVRTRAAPERSRARSSHWPPTIRTWARALPYLFGYVAKLPGPRITLRAVKPELRGEIGDESLAAIIRRRRRTLRLKLDEAARALGITPQAYRSWETGEFVPAARNYPQLIEWLRFEPWPETVPLGQRLLTSRLRAGLIRKELARLVGVAEAVITRCELETLPISAASTDRIEAFLGGAPKGVVPCLEGRGKRRFSTVISRDVTRRAASALLDKRTAGA